MISINGVPINVTLFPDNTTQVWKLGVADLPDKVVIEWDYTHEGELMQLAQLKDLLDKEGIYAKLDIKYLPYARQDKRIGDNRTFALRSFAKLLNSLKFPSIEILDPHSSLATSLIEKSSHSYPFEQWKAVWDIIKPDCVAFPDKGASLKYQYQLSDSYKNNPPNFIKGEKVRDQETGHIIQYLLRGLGGPETLPSLSDKSILIVDDICDGGATFVALANVLSHHRIKNLSLFVTHGIFSKGLGPLLKAGISRIFTAKGEAVGYSDHTVGYIPYESIKPNTSN